MAAPATAAEREPTVTILCNGQVYSPAEMAATALVMVDDRIATSATTRQPERRRPEHKKLI